MNEETAAAADSTEDEEHVNCSALFDRPVFEGENQDNDTVLARNEPNDGLIVETPSPRARNLGNINQNKHRFDDGYNSDGYDGPFVPRIIGEDNKEKLERQERQIDEEVPVKDGPVTIKEENSEVPKGKLVLIDDADIKKMKVKELQHELKHRLVPFGGVKEKLVEQLLQAMVEEKPKYA